MTSEISQETIAKIRALSPEKFEPTFISQLNAERKIAMVIVYFMQEAYRRREWARSYPSFSSYCCDRLKMSSSDFYRKYSVLKTIEEIPELESKILDGAINASTVAKVSHFIHRESKNNGENLSVNDKRELFTKIEGLSYRQVERELATRSPQSAMPDKTRQITQSTFVRQFTSDAELEMKIERAKELLAHTLPQPPSDCQLFKKVTDLALEKLDPILREQRRQRKSNAGANLSPNQSVRTNSDLEAREIVPSGARVSANANVDTGRNPSTSEITSGNVNTSGSVNTGGDANVTGIESLALEKSIKAAKAYRERIPTAIRNEVFKRDSYMCVHVNSNTGKLCGSRFALEIDHIIPVGHGGDNSIENLRVLCRTHNQLRALETYGRKKMAKVVKSLDLDP